MYSKQIWANSPAVTSPLNATRLNYMEDGIDAVNGAPSVIVASSTATASQKKMASFVCDGTADQVEINAALASLPGAKGTVQLTPGTFTVAASINLGVSQCLRGQGEDATLIMGAATGFHVIHMGNRTGGAGNAMTNFVKLQDLSVSSAGGANSFDTVWADGLGIGSLIMNVKSSEGKYNFRLTDCDQCAFYNIKGYNPRTASIYCEIGYENTWGNVAFYSPSMALSDNNSTCFLIDANAVQGAPNRLDRISVYGALFYAGTTLTGTAGIKANVGASAFTVIGSLSENLISHVELNNTTQLTWNSCSMMHNAPPSTNGFKCSTDNHSITVISSRFQQMTNLFNGVSGFSKICLLGLSENQGNITNLWTGTFGAKTGTDTVFAGNGILASGLDNERYDWVMTNKVRIPNGSPDVGKLLGATDTSGNATWTTPASAVSAPVSATAAGTAGQVAFDTSFVYVCTATNTWKRVAITAW